MLPGLSPLGGLPIEARFDDGLASSDGGLLLLREVEQRLGMARRMAACIRDPRAPERVSHRLDEILRFRMLMIAAGYEDGDDADTLRRDPLFKLAMQRLPDEADLCSQSTVSRTENLPDARALLRLGRAMVDHYCDSFRQVPRRSSWRAAQFDTLRLRLLKLAARVRVLKRCVRLHLPQATPDQAIFTLALNIFGSVVNYPTQHQELA